MRLHTLDRVPFTKFEFGFTSAEMERAHNPRLLIDGFLDTQGHVNQLIEGRPFLVLGYKGSGKSALGQRIRLLSDQSKLLFANIINLSDFPYSEFSKMADAGEDPEAKLPNAWSWLLLVKLFETLSRDESIALHRNSEFKAACEALKSIGLLPGGDLKKIVMISSSLSFKFKVPLIMEGDWTRENKDSEIRIPLFTERLRQIVAGFRSDARHLLIIDGLDDVLTRKVVQYESLAALVLEIGRLNMFLSSNQVPIKIILLCRTDLFERLPGPNKNKIRQDAAITLDWYHDPRDPDKSLLMRLANLRASLVDDRVKDVIEEYIPSGITRGRKAKLYLKKSLLLDYTRHTPRDFLRLLHYIQNFTRGMQPTVSEIQSAIRDYSIDYFLPEVKDELVGSVDDDKLDAVFQLLGSIANHEFSFREVEGRWKNFTVLRDFSPQDILRALFECSAIGNVREEGKARRFTFRYRNRHSSVDFTHRLRIHPGLWKAVNLERM